MVLDQKKLTPTYLAFGTINVQYTMQGDETILTATATCSASGSTQSAAFANLEDTAAVVVATITPSGANISSYDVCNTGIKIAYTPSGVVPESIPEFNSHPSLNLTGALRSSNASTGQGLLEINPEKGTISVGAEQLSGTYAGNYATSNPTPAGGPLLGVAGTSFPIGVFSIKQDGKVGAGNDITNRTALGVRRTTAKYAVADTVPTFKSDFGETFGAGMNYEVQDNTGRIWELGSTSFGVERLDANDMPLGAFSVNMATLGAQNVPYETCNLRVAYDGTTYVRGLNINGMPVTIEPGTGYLKVGADPAPTGYLKVGAEVGADPGAEAI